MIKRLLALAIALPLLGACALTAQGDPPASTAPAEAALTDLPPTPSPRPTAAPGPAQILGRAIAATEALERYRMGFYIDPMRNKPSSTSGQPLNVKPVEYTLLRDGEKTRIIGSGEQILHIPGVIWEVITGVEIIHAADVVYAHGPIPLPGGSDLVWYNLGDRPPEGFDVIPPDGATLLRLLRSAIDLGEFAPDGVEQLDGQSCTFYRGGAPAAFGAMSALGYPLAASLSARSGGASSGNKIAQAAMVFSICANYVRRVEIGIRGQAYGSESQWFDLRADLIFVDHGQVTITLPEQTFTLPYTNEVGTATVWHGGNVRVTPMSGEPEDQARAGEKLLR